MLQSKKVLVDCEYLRKVILFINTIQVIESKQIVSCLFTLEIIVYWEVVIICEITRDV